MCIDSNGYMSTNHDLQERNEDTFDAWLAGRVSQEVDNHLLADDDRLLADDDRLLTDGTVLSEYKVVAFLGRGGCGEVYSARHEKLGSMAAVKLLRKDTPSMRLRFEREAQILVKKRYREFPQFIVYGEYQERPYLIEELLVPKDLLNTSQYLFNSLQQFDLPPIELFNDAAIQQEFQEITKKLK